MNWQPVTHIVDATKTQSRWVIWTACGHKSSLQIRLVERSLAGELFDLSPIAAGLLRLARDEHRFPCQFCPDPPPEPPAAPAAPDYLGFQLL